MPHPGLNVIENKFDGRIKDLKGAFVEELPNLVRRLLAPENLIPKKIANKQLKAKDLCDYFTAYMTLFSDGKALKVQAIFEATHETHNRTAVAAAEELYYKGMQKGFDVCKSFLKRDEIEDLHQQLKIKAMKEFFDKQKFGREKYTYRFCIILEKQIETMYMDFTARNDKTQTLISLNPHAAAHDADKGILNAMGSALEWYRSAMSANMDQNEGDDLLTERELRIKHENFKSEALNRFLEHENVQRGSPLKNYVYALETELERHYKELQQQMLKLKKRTENSNNFASVSARELYRSKMNGLHGDGTLFFFEQELLREHNKIKNIAIDHFKRQPDIGVNEISKTFLDNLGMALDTIFQEYQERNKQCMDATARYEYVNSVASAKDFYVTRMQEQLKILDSTSTCDWRIRHLKTKQDALDHFERRRPKYGSEDREKHLVQLEKGIESTYVGYEAMLALREQQEETSQKDASARDCIIL